jgi:phosphopantothenoylcysteine decarboxylase/phosphopantothenate--cysteine ligase
MWDSPIVQDNLAKLVEKLGVRTVGPDTGHLACGTSGKGRMAEPADILEAVRALFA